MPSKLHVAEGLIASLTDLTDDELVSLLTQFPIGGGDHEDESDEDEQDDEGQDDEDEDEEDGDSAGKKRKSSESDQKPKGKLYTKEELDSIVENAVKDRLKRAERNKNRDSAKDKGEFEELANSLQKEIDEEWKPKADEAEKLQSQVEELSEVVTEQIDSILDTLPKDLRDLDLGEDEDPVKRLRWLITKVVPKANKRRGKNDDDTDDERPRGTNKPGPKPRNKQGEDDRKPVAPPVSRKRF